MTSRKTSWHQWILAGLKKLLKLVIYWGYKEPERSSKAEYRRVFDLDDPDNYTARLIRKRALAKAWEIRNFEIELYWKRATYFWAFMITIFAAVGFTIKTGSGEDDQMDFLRYILMCTGLLVAFAWQFTNRGSKSWMRNWEKHIDMLEDEFTGPLYKLVSSKVTFSVSKINEIVSWWFILLWSALILHFLADKELLNIPYGDVEPQYFFPLLMVAVFIVSMVFGYGRGRFGYKEFEIYRRRVDS